MRRTLTARALALLAGIAAFSSPADAETPSPTRVVMIGTGNPGIDPERSGPATAVVVNDVPYLVDMGPGVVRRAKAAQNTTGIAAVDPMKFRVVFVTHLHSDHTVGYADLIFTPWTQGRRVPLEVYGPSGIKEMTEHLRAAYKVDIDTRTNSHGNQREFPQGSQVNAHQVKAGLVYEDANVKVTAFPTRHAMESFGYRFETKDRVIVISGDSGPAQETIDACKGCDVLIHEAWSPAALALRPATMHQFAALYHTTTPQLAELARKAKPALLVLYHYNGLSREELFSDLGGRYAGHFAIARDLDVY